ncbi:unnamed protein product [Allacma fusca]|uniref:Uncharacterized protein n=1 Tax=Allacma fusca TaxID=39272 RepID=A0A8J2L133_9HEXA|nr:unnamed protein product [Allacma fusca]
MSHTPPPSNKMEETNETPPQIVDPVVVSSNEGVDEASRIRQIRKTMDEAAAHGLAHFKIVMNEFVDSKKLYKTSDIITYQKQARDAILQAFTATFSPETLETVDPTILHSYTKQLTELLDFPELTFTFLARYDHSTNTILKDLTKCTLEAERVYDDEMEGFEPSQKSENEIKERHNLAREKAMAKFTDLMKPLNVNATVCSKEIEWKLQENLQDLTEEFVVLEPRTEQTNVEHELHPGQNHIQEIYQEKSGSVWDLLNPVVQTYAYFFGGKSQAPGDLIEVVTSPKTDMPNSSFGNLVVQQSIHDRRDIEIGWLQFLWSKLFGRNY